MLSEYLNVAITFPSFLGIVTNFINIPYNLDVIMAGLPPMIVGGAQCAFDLYKSIKFCFKESDVKKKPILDAIANIDKDINELYVARLHKRKESGYSIAELCLQIIDGKQKFAELDDDTQKQCIVMYPIVSDDLYK